jgi:heme/copper-type cytochrome/quinol oxidase subunit 1
MSLLTNPAFGPKVALMYVTAGALIDVWTAVYYFTYGRGRMTDDNPGDDNTTWFWVAGFFLTGLVLIILGLVLGPLGRAARESELPPKDASRQEAQIQNQAAANPNPVVAGQAVGMAPAPVAQVPVAPGTPAVPQQVRPPAPTGYTQPTV